MKHLSTTLAAIALVGCGGNDNRASDAQIEEYGKSEIRKMLKDGDAATFSNVYVSRKAGVTAVCGSVNAANGFGGKAGSQRFISGGASILEEQMGDGEMDKSWQQLC